MLISETGDYTIEALQPFYRAKNITTAEWFEILYTFTTACCKKILKISGSIPFRKPNYGISKLLRSRDSC